MPLQHHLRVFLERLDRVGFVVLRADREDDSAPRQLAGVFLKRDKRLAEGVALADDQAFEAIIADHAPPEGVVEIEHQALGRAALLRGQ